MEMRKRIGPIGSAFVPVVAGIGVLVGGILPWSLLAQANQG